MTHEDDLTQVQRVLQAMAAANPHAERDIAASLQAFDLLHQPKPLHRAAPGWLARILSPGGFGVAGMAAAAAVAVVILRPEADLPPRLDTLPPGELRLAMPETPAAPVIPDPAMAKPGAVDGDVLAAFAASGTQRFALPWTREHLLIVTDVAGLPAQARVLYRAQGRVAALIAPSPSAGGARSGAELQDGLHQFAVALAGLALLRSGQPTGEAWDEARLRAAAQQAAAGNPRREAALRAVLAPD